MTKAECVGHPPDGNTIPFNDFSDEISSNLAASSFSNFQYFLYGLPNQRLFGVKVIYRTLMDGSLDPKPGWNHLTAGGTLDSAPLKHK